MAPQDFKQQFENYLFLDLLYITDSIYTIIFHDVPIDVSTFTHVQEWQKNHIRSLPRDRKNYVLIN